MPAKVPGAVSYAHYGVISIRRDALVAETLLCVGQTYGRAGKEECIHKHEERQWRA
jgi:hypothetical protein